MNPIPSSAPGSEPETSILAVCPLCETAYQPVGAHVLAAREESHLLYLQCRRCGTAAMVVVSAGATGVATIGIMTDLTPAEIVTSSDRTPLGDDDVIDLVQAFRRNDHVGPTLQRS